MKKEIEFPKPYSISQFSEFSYNFTTENQTKYTIEVFTYEDFTEIPLSGKIFSFSLYKWNNENNTAKQDDRVYATVVKFLSDLLNDNANAVIVVFSNIDGKELARKRLFDKWFDKVANDKIEKHNGKVNLDNKIVFTTLFIHADNAEKDIIIEIFRNF